MRGYKFLLITAVIFVSCQNNKGSNSEKFKKEIADAEKSFEIMATEKGIAEAFWFFADSNAVIKRQHDTLIQGRENIRKFYSARFYTNASVKWSPDFIGVSSNGDLGYTYGKYVWQSKDSTGKPEEFKGVFHTVWKKQHDGTWKYVWD